MSSYQQYDRLIYWNKTTNMDLLNNVLQSFQILNSQTQRKKQKRNTINQQNDYKILANQIFFNVLLSLHNKYPEFQNFNLQSSMIDKHCKMIEGQITKSTNLEALQNSIEEKIETIVKDKLAESHRKSRELYYSPSFLVRESEIKEKQQKYLEAFVCMLNIFSSQCVFRLITTNSIDIEKSTKSMEIKDVLVCYYGEQENKRMGVKMKLEGDAGSGVQEYWLQRREKETQEACFLRLLFVIYTLCVSNFAMGDELTVEIQKEEKRMLRLFLERVHAALGYLDMNSFYSAFVYLGQTA